MLNRKGVLRWVLLAMLVASLVTNAPARAEEPLALGDRISGKLIRGMVNRSTGWIEVPRQMYEVWTQEGLVRGLLRGPFDGIGMFFARTIAGVVETSTFPVPLPAYKPLLTPTYAWESENSAATMSTAGK